MGQPSAPFLPQRGLRQGDPLSPCIFIICSEVLSGLISKAREDGILHGISIATNVSPISHLLYADDIILFCKAKPTETIAIKSIRYIYQQASGQRVNLDKSEMIFSLTFPLKLLPTSLNIWACLLILEGPKRLTLILFWTEFGKN